MKQPVVLVHGACSQSAHMEPWRAYFAAAGHPCAAPSLPGHAADDESRLATVRIGDYVAALSRVCAGFDRPPVIIGHSLGGLLAQVLASRFACAGIVLVASLPPGPMPVTPRAMPHFARRALHVLAGRPFRATASGLTALALHHLAPAERDEILPAFVGESGRAFRQVVFGMVRVRPDRITCPVLVVHGAADRIVPVAVGRRLARRYRAELLLVPGHGHWLIADSLIDVVATEIRRRIDAQG